MEASIKRVPNVKILLCWPSRCHFYGFAMVPSFWRGSALQTERSESRGGDGAPTHKWISLARAYVEARSVSDVASK